jgi:A/G-specific adenine glycosylase
MELGATVCSPAPKCGVCPLADRCAAHLAGRTGDLPPVAKRAKPKASTLWLVAFEAEGHLLLQAPSAKGLLAGLWRWPTFDAATLSLEPTAHRPQPTTTWPAWTQVYTHRREAVRPLHIPLVSRFASTEELHWVPRAELQGLALGKRDQRLRDLLDTPGQVPLEAPDPKALIRSLSK